MNTTRLLLVDDHQLILDSMQLLLAAIAGMQVIGVENDSRRVPDMLARYRSMCCFVICTCRICRD